MKLTRGQPPPPLFFDVGVVDPILSLRSRSLFICFFSNLRCYGARAVSPGKETASRVLIWDRRLEALMK